MANTSILIKRSTTTGRPTSLAAGEFAYSYQSNTLFFGSPSGTGVINVGGQYYTSTLDAATSANTAGTLVKRDSNNNFYGGLYGNANTSTALLNSRNFSITGGDISATAVGFDGTSAVALNASLNTIAGLSAGIYGGTTSIPVVTVAANGRVMAIANTTIATSFTVSGNTGSGTQAGGGTLTVQGGGTGITTTVTGSSGSETVTINTDNTVVRSNTASVGPQTIGTDLYVSGNLYISGTQTYVNTSIVQTTDSLILLAANNTGDVIDIGFVGRYGSGSSLATGLVRDAGNKAYYLFAGVDSSSIANANTIANNLFTSANTATLYSNLVAVTANIATGNITTANITSTSITTANVTSATIGNLILTNALPIASGGTNNTTFNNGSITFFDGTKLNNLANTGTAGTYANSNTVAVITTDAYGRVSAVTNTAIAIDTSQITSGTLGVPRGGTGAATFTSGSILIGSGTGALSTLANSTYTATGTGTQNNTITSVTVDSYGRLTAATFSAISGLTVGQGGTGVSTFTTNGMVYGNGSGAMLVTAAAGTADQTWSNQIMTVTNAGVPVWSNALDGGQF
jgi:hypothetical protein